MRRYAPAGVEVHCARLDCTRSASRAAVAATAGGTFAAMRALQLRRIALFSPTSTAGASK